MDPDEALRQCRVSANRLIAEMDSDEELESVSIHDANLLVESFQALDGWLSKKGFLPQDWNR